MSIFESTISLLAPTECINCGVEGSVICSDCAEQYIKPFGERCWRCNSLSPHSRTCASCRHVKSPAHVWIVTDYDGAARDLLSRYKFGHQRSVAESIAKLMVDTFESPNLTSSNYSVVPIPTATSRIRERGFGHSELLAKKVAAKLALPYENVLRRLGQTRQLGARREDRLRQLTASFAAKDPQSLKGRHVLLIDDVVTTGGTMIAATKALRAAGAKQVDALLFAKRL